MTIEVAHLRKMSVGASQAVQGVVWQTVVLCLGLAGIVIANFGLAIAEIIPIYVCGIINVFAIYFMYTPLHEAVHGNISGRSESMAWLDVWVGRVAGLFIGTPYSAHKTVHLTHHRHTNDPELDPDHWVKGSNPITIMLRCTTILASYLSYCRRHYNRPEMRRAYWQSIGGVCLTALPLIGLGFAVGWQLPVFGYVVPSLVATCILGFLFDWIVHVPHKERARFENTRVMETTGWRDTLVTWLYLQQNYHGVHHAFPKIPFIRYRAFFRANRKDIQSAGLPVRQY